MPKMEMIDPGANRSLPKPAPSRMPVMTGPEDVVRVRVTGIVIVFTPTPAMVMAPVYVPAARSAVCTATLTVDGVVDVDGVTDSQFVLPAETVMVVAAVPETLIVALPGGVPVVEPVKVRLGGLAEMDGTSETARVTWIVCDAGEPEGVATVAVPM